MPMTPERWLQIERLYHEAAALASSDREAFLREACGNDETLRREVQSLLESDQSSFLAKPAVEAAGGGVKSGQPIESAESERRRGKPFPVWARAIVAVATIRTAIALVLYLSAGEAPLRIVPGVEHPPLPPLWIYAALSSTFVALGLGLVVGSRNDPRAEWLGGTLTLIGAISPWPTRGRWTSTSRTPHRYSRGFRKKSDTGCVAEGSSC